MCTYLCYICIWRQIVIMFDIQRLSLVTIFQLFPFLKLFTEFPFLNISLSRYGITFRPSLVGDLSVDVILILLHLLFHMVFINW